MENKIGYEQRAEVYSAALATFGAEAQLIVALEEMSELQKEICKALRGQVHPAHIAEEIADATIMLEQVRRIFCIPEETVADMMDKKIARLAFRIAAHKEMESKHGKE